jgi:hypothetical protein
MDMPYLHDHMQVVDSQGAGTVRKATSEKCAVLLQAGSAKVVPGFRNINLSKFSPPRVTCECV